MKIQGPTQPASVHIFVCSSVLLRLFQARIQFNGVVNDIRQSDATLPLLVNSHYICFSHTASFSTTSSSKHYTYGVAATAALTSDHVQVHECACVVAGLLAGTRYRGRNTPLKGKGSPPPDDYELPLSPLTKRWSPERSHLL